METKKIVVFTGAVAAGFVAQGLNVKTAHAEDGDIGGVTQPL